MTAEKSGKKPRKLGSKRQRESESAEEPLLGSSHPEAKTLYDLAIKVKNLAPWEWMEETDLFGVENPDTGELGFVSIMGSIGEYQAIALYLGPEGFYDFVHLQENANLAERLIEISHLQAAFSDREFLEKEDLDLIKELGLKFRGADAWPKFRSYRPGYLPWHVTVGEARLLIYALARTLDFAMRIRDEANPIRPVGPVPKDGVLVLATKRDGEELVWEDQVRVIPRPSRKPLQPRFDHDLFEGLKRIPQGGLEIETDLSLAPATIGGPNERPMVVYLLMVADKDSGFVLGMEAMTAEDSLSRMHEQIPNVVAKFLLKAKVLPRRLLVRSDLLRQLLRTFCQSLNIELLQSDELTSIGSYRSNG
jgi:hypothetical protein